MTTVFYAWPYGTFLRYRVTSGERNIMKQIKAPIFLRADLTIETIQTLKEKVNPSILKDYFSSRKDPSIFTSIAPMLLDPSNETS